MIITVAPFPSIEYIYAVDQLIPNQDLCSKSAALSILSKCIHSAEMIKVLQDEPILISSLGGFAGKYIKHYLDKSRIKADIVWSEQETPHCVKIGTTLDKQTYSFKVGETEAIQNEILHKYVIKLTQKLKLHLNQVSTLVLAGYLPTHIEPTIYGEWVKEAMKHNIKTLVSTGQKEVLKNTLIQKPYALMFTAKQLENLGVSTVNEEEFLKVLYSYLQEGVHYIGIYLKNKGAYMLSKHKICYIEIPLTNEELDNTASSGAFLGTFAIGVQRKYEQEKFFKMCVASALIARCNIDEPICTKKDMDTLSKKMKVKELPLPC